MTAHDQEIFAAARALTNSGGIITIPTDTTYGLICKVNDTKGIDRIYEIKQRDTSKPLIILGSRTEDLVRWTSQDSKLIFFLAERFWPGPLTIVAQASREVPREIMSGGTTIGLRVPNHSACRKLLDLLPFSAAASTSANISGSGISKSLEDVQAQIGHLVDYLLGDCEEAPKGNESTVLDVSKDVPQILRAGSLDPEKILQALAEYKSHVDV